VPKVPYLTRDVLMVLTFAVRRRTAWAILAAVAPDSVALVHDYLLVLRGAERAFAEIAEIWPAAPIHTLLYDSRGTLGRFAGRDVVTSPLQRLAVDQRSFRRLLPLYPWATRRLELHEHTLVVSSSSAFAHGVRPAPGARHVCYCHTPFRYAWHDRRGAREEVPPAVRPLLELVLWRHRRFDRDAAVRVTRFVANSVVTRERIRRFWRRDAVIVHPPVHVERFARPAEPSDELLFVGEVVPHKRLELALEAAARAGRRMSVVGTGPELPRLRARFRGTATFHGRVDDHTLEELYARAAALVVPGVEEFGIAAVESQAAGRPVIAANAGGSRETVLPDETGWLVPPDDVGALARAMRRDTGEFDPATIRQHAEHFSAAGFRRRLLEAVEDLL
jgi:glycosyltransferase involved in cell wall biosynthesis